MDQLYCKNFNSCGDDDKSEKCLTISIVASVLMTIHIASSNLLMMVAVTAPKASDLFFSRPTYSFDSSFYSNEVLAVLRSSSFSTISVLPLMSKPCGFRSLHNTERSVATTQGIRTHSCNVDGRDMGGSPPTCSLSTSPLVEPLA